MAFSFYKQLDQMDCGPTCLRMVAKHFGKHYSAQTLREMAQISREGVSLLGISEAAEKLGLKTVGVKVDLHKLASEVPLPCILHWGQSHFVVLYRVSGNPEQIGPGILSKIRGGRNSPSRIDKFLDEFGNERSGNGNHLSIENTLDESRSLRFHIADPAKGIISYNTIEFAEKWLSTKAANTSRGVALVLEPTPKFFEASAEASTKLQFSGFFKYLWNFRALLVQLSLSVFVGSGLQLLFPILTQSVVDTGIGSQNLPFVYLVLIAQLMLALSSSTVDFLRSWILLHISTRLNLAILSSFLSKLMRLPVSFFDVKHFGDIMQRIGDHNRIESFLTGSTLSMLFSFVNLIIFGAVLAYYDARIFVIAVLASFIYAAWVTLFLRQRRKLDNKRFDVSARNQSQIVQLINGMQDIKLSNAETSKRWEWERTQAVLFRWNVRNLSLSQVQQGGALLINQVKNILITFLTVKAVIDGNLTLGGMMSVQYLLGQFNAPIEQMVAFLQNWQDAQLSLERLNEIHGLSDEESIDENKRSNWSPDSDVVISALHYTYPGAGNERVLTDINLRIPSGKTTAIVGTSGSGKTTLLKLLLRFYSAQEGSIQLEKRAGAKGQKAADDDGQWERGLNIKYISHKAWRKECGVVMQDGFIFSDSIARNIAVGEESIDQNRLYHAARVANIYDFVESLPLGFHTKIGAEGNGISQGQKQRILIARAVYKNPRLLLFDEATNSLDANNEAVIMRNLKSFFRGRTVVIVAHRLSTVRHADQIIVMEKGKIVESGNHQALVAKKGKYFELVTNQLELAES